MKPAHSLTEPGSMARQSWAGLLKYSDAYYHSVTQQLLAHALNRKGRPGRLYDWMPSVRAIVRSAAARDYRWSSIVSGVVGSAPFRMKTIVPSGCTPRTSQSEAVKSQRTVWKPSTARRA